MASVIGLAPIRPDLKGRLRELLCIHGRLGKLVPEVGIAPTSPRLQRGANLSQLLGGDGARASARFTAGVLVVNELIFDPNLSVVEAA